MFLTVSGYVLLIINNVFENDGLLDLEKGNDEGNWFKVLDCVLQKNLGLGSLL